MKTSDDCSIFAWESESFRFSAEDAMYPEAEGGPP